MINSWKYIFSLKTPFWSSLKLVLNYMLRMQMLFHEPIVITIAITPAPSLYFTVVPVYEHEQSALIFAKQFHIIYCMDLHNTLHIFLPAYCLHCSIYCERIKHSQYTVHKYTLMTHSLHSHTFYELYPIM